VARAADVACSRESQNRLVFKARAVPHAEGRGFDARDTHSRKAHSAWRQKSCPRESSDRLSNDLRLQLRFDGQQAVQRATRRRASDWHYPEEPELLQGEATDDDRRPVLRAGLTDVLLTGMLTR
jgi:hypothetical protein